MRFVVLFAVVALAAGGSVALAQSGGGEAKIVLPEGEGKALVEDRCASCHGLGLVVGQKRSKAEWEATIDLMMDRGAQVSDADYAAISAYLSAHFGPAK